MCGFLHSLWGSTFSTSILGQHFHLKIEIQLSTVATKDAREVLKIHFVDLTSIKKQYLLYAEFVII